jgi:hypothetical protein
MLYTLLFALLLLCCCLVGSLKASDLIAHQLSQEHHYCCPLLELANSLNN